jgi:hypothetical protein
MATVMQKIKDIEDEVTTEDAPPVRASPVRDARFLTIRPMAGRFALPSGHEACGFRSCSLGEVSN